MTFSEASGDHTIVKRHCSDTAAVASQPEAARDSSAEQRQLHPHPPSAGFVWCCRGVCVCFFIGLWLWQVRIQGVIDALWRHLLDSYVYNHASFETGWTMLANVPISTAFYVLTEIKCLQKYKLDKDQPGWRNVGVRAVLVEGLQYSWPFLFLDFVTVKKYQGVDPSEWALRRQNCIQTTRALPQEAPSLFQICYHLLGAYILFDAMFCTVHYVLHRSSWLYKHIHAPHHRHQVLYSKVVNQLSLVERVALILSANQALKIMGAHPLTRTIFVPLFLVSLTENHCGYDLPWSWDKLVPFGLVGGAAKHWAHHVRGDRYYAPFFTLLDDYVLPRLTKQ